MKKFTLIAGLVMAMTSLSQAQDDCASAVPVTAGSYTVAAINGTGVPNPDCTAGNLATAGEWYVYTAANDTMVTVTTDLAINAGKDTRVHIYTGPCNNLTCITGSDDLASNYLSTASFNAVAGTTYYIAFDNRWSSSGFQFDITESAVVIPVIAFTAQNISTSSNICCVADMNGDYLDDVVTTGGADMTIHAQLAGGGFNTTAYPLPGLTTGPGWSIAAGDYDANGYTDLVFGGSSVLTVIKANANGSAYTEVPYPQNIFTQRTNFIDINNDGNLDLFACHDVAQSHAYRNDGNGNLIFDISLMPTLAVGGNYQSMWSDYDNDGDQDLYIAKCRGGAPVGDPQRINLLYRNNGDGTFTESGAAAGVNDGAQSWSTAIEDFDNDGDMDFLLSNISDANRFYQNNGDGTFTDIYASTGIDPQVGSWELQAGDFNNDGWVDFLWQNGRELYLNNGNLTFTGYDLVFSEGGIGDLNNDGFLDVQNGNKVYYNTPNANNWIKINLQGVISNRNGIGARVEIYGAWGKQIREIRSGHGFSHQSTLNAHFGIGTETQVTQVRVLWPSGQVDIINNPAINQATLMVEGANSPVSVVEPTEAKFAVYPNPASDMLMLSNLDIAQVRNITIYGADSRRVSIINRPTDNMINVKNLVAGAYVITIETQNGEMFTNRFVKQ